MNQERLWIVGAIAFLGVILSALVAYTTTPATDDSSILERGRLAAHRCEAFCRGMDESGHAGLVEVRGEVGVNSRPSTWTCVCATHMAADPE